MSAHDGGWDPYDVWYTRVLLPRQRAELAAGQAGAIASPQDAPHLGAAVAPEGGALATLSPVTAAPAAGERLAAA